MQREDIYNALGLLQPKAFLEERRFFHAEYAWKLYADYLLFGKITEPVIVDTLMKDEDRQTGRTTNYIIELIFHSYAGNKCCLVSMNQRTTQLARERYKNYMQIMQQNFGGPKTTADIISNTDPHKLYYLSNQEVKLYDLD